MTKRIFFFLLLHLSHEGYNIQNATSGMGGQESRINDCGKHSVKRLLAVKICRKGHVMCCMFCVRSLLSLGLVTMRSLSACVLTAFSYVNIALISAYATPPHTATT
jgi:hypothetical protein